MDKMIGFEVKATKAIIIVYNCNAVSPALKCVLIYFISFLVCSPLGTSRVLYDGVDYDSSVLCTLQYRTGCIQRTGFSVPYHVH